MTVSSKQPFSACTQYLQLYAASVFHVCLQHGVEPSASQAWCIQFVSEVNSSA